MADIGGRGGSMAVEVSTGLHIEEPREGAVLKDSTDKHAKRLELGNGGVYCSAKNPLACSPLYSLTSYPSP